MRTSICTIICIVFTFLTALGQPANLPVPKIRYAPGNALDHVEHSVLNLPVLDSVPPAFYTQLWWFGDNYFSFLPSPEHLYRQGFTANAVHVVHTPNYGTGGPPPMTSVAPGVPANAMSNQDAIVANSQKIQMLPFRPAVPGKTVYLIVSYKCPESGPSPDLLGMIDLSIPPPFDTLFDLAASVNEPSFLPNNEARVGSNLEWQLEAPVGGDDRSILIALNTSLGMEPHIGEEIPMEVRIQYEGHEPELAEINLRISGSYDPNAMHPSVKMDDDCVMGGDLIDYHVCFQNIGDGPTSYIRVESKLDPNLDFSSFQLLGFHKQIDPCGNGSVPCFEIRKDALQRKVFFEFQGLRLEGLHDPSITDVETTKGWLDFSINVKPGYRLGKDIVCRSEIYFDNNTPIQTNKAITTCATEKKHPVDETGDTPKRGKKTWILIVAVLVALLVGAGIWFYIRRKELL